MVRWIDMAEKSKVARNLITSNFGFVGNVDPMHRLGARGDYPKLAPPTNVTPSFINLGLHWLKITKKNHAKKPFIPISSLICF